MLLLANVSNDYKQKFQLLTEDNKSFLFKLEFIENQQSWFFSLTYNNLSINNKRLITSPNFLRQFQNILPFGMSCITDDGSEPFEIDDFSKERVKLYILTSGEVQTMETSVYA